ncbi:unnamed protein product, partial [Polarella glacialis]
PRKQRGKAFGWLFAASNAGYICGLMLSTSSSHMTSLGGWRAAFLLFSFLTLVWAWILWQVHVEASFGLFAQSRTWALLDQPRRNTNSICTDVVESLSVIAHRRSFFVLILQGAFASTTIKALAYMTMWYQYLGFSDTSAAMVTSAIPLGYICGAIASGYASDSLATHYPMHGRICFGQLANFMNIAVLALMFKVCNAPNPEEPGDFSKSCSLSFLFGFVSVMTYSAVVKPMFADIVPSNMIATVVGAAAAIDGAFASFASAPVVAYITENVFRYKQSTLAIADMPEWLRLNNASALGRGIACVMITSSVLTFLSFGFLHLTYPEDRKWTVDQEGESSVLTSGDTDDESGGSEKSTASARVRRVRFADNYGASSSPQESIQVG